ncbi:MAG: helix-turn-helix domain-containing protein [Bacteroidales bacterium]|nr:helix-turn-helix domain-containing protein [Bacteroidales bacterium]
MDKISAERIYISVAEAVDLFGIPKNRIYRMIRKKMIPVMRNGERSTRIPLAAMDSLFPRVEASPNAVTCTRAETEKPACRFDATDSYTISEVTEKFGVSPSTAATIIRRFSIPKCQKGRFVYVPKSEIDKVFNPNK